MPVARNWSAYTRRAETEKSAPGWDRWSERPNTSWDDAKGPAWRAPGIQSLFQESSSSASLCEVRSAPLYCCPWSSRSSALKSVFGVEYFNSRATLVCLAFARPRPMASTPSRSAGRHRDGQGYALVTSERLREFRMFVLPTVHAAGE